MSKLTLSVDSRVVSSAKRYARHQGVSISSMVEAYLSSIAGPFQPAAFATPVLRSLKGVLKKGDPEQFRKHLAAKYR